MIYTTKIQLATWINYLDYVNESSMADETTIDNVMKLDMNDGHFHSLSVPYHKLHPCYQIPCMTDNGS
jgi:hypothetical protein